MIMLKEEEPREWESSEDGCIICYYELAEPPIPKAEYEDPRNQPAGYGDIWLCKSCYKDVLESLIDEVETDLDQLKRDLKKVEEST